MGNHPGRTKLEIMRPNIVLPADGATVARSRSRGLILVAHTGQAHLGAPIKHALLRDLARAQAAAPTTTEASPANRAPAAVARDLPEVIPFRHATSHRFAVSGGQIHLTLSAVGERNKLDVEVELKMDGQLVERLAQHRNKMRRGRIAFVLAALLVVTIGLIAGLAHV